MTWPLRFDGVCYFTMTQELVKTLFDYNNGELFWNVKIKNKPDVYLKSAGTLNEKHNRYQIIYNKKRYYRSRLIFLYHNGYLPEMVDHINRNTADDRIENLRACNRIENGRNRTSAKNSTSKYLGVNFKEGSWIVRVSTPTKRLFGGSYKKEIDAALAYNKLAVKYYGEFANLNIIQP